MIISYKHNFIFMHCRKTAGSSITAALNSQLGPDDIQLGAWPESISAGGKYNRKALSIASLQLPRLVKASLKYSLQQHKLSLSPKAINTLTKEYYTKKFSIKGHALASLVRNVDPEFWNSSFKFCFVRNPWTLAVSDYYWRTHKRAAEHIPFKEFLLRLQDPDRPDPERIRPRLITNWDIYTINEKIAVDHVGRYENLVNELEYIQDKIGLSINLSNIHAKGNIRKKSKNIMSHYDNETEEILASIYQKEIKQFGYTPPQE